MIYRKLLFQILIRLLLLIVLTFLTAWILLATNYPLLFILPTLLLCYFIFRLVHYLNATNRLLSHFFLSVENKDGALKIPQILQGDSFEELRQSMQQVNQTIKDLRLQHQKKEIISESIIENASVGILTFNERGVVRCINRKARKLLTVHHLVNIKALLKVDEAFLQTIEQLKAGEQRIYKMEQKGNQFHLLISCNLLKCEGEEYKLLSFTDIKNELDAQELQSWQSLINVLTHEIMNSVSPLTCLTEKLESNYQNLEEGTVLDQPLLEKTRTGLNIIKEQGEGLMYFVESYRKLSRIPNPILKPVQMSTFFEHIFQLIDKENDLLVSYHLQIDSGCEEIIFDPKLMNQVLLNVIKNAQQAIEGGGNIWINLTLLESGRKEIKIKDDGKGISKADFKNIFVPFYTTKEEGSGIGLSVARQIIRKHKGNIVVKSVEGEGCEVNIILH